MNAEHVPVGHNPAAEMSDVDPACCPLCGADNACMMTCSAGSDAPCWCESLTFPENLRERIPLPLRDRVCVCRTCVENM